MGLSRDEHTNKPRQVSSPDADTPTPVVIRVPMGKKPDGGGKPISHLPGSEEYLAVKGGRKYRVGPILAAGGMGVVRSAADLDCQRVVAMKALKEGATLTEDDLNQFLQEARITSQLEHPNIVPVHELGFDENDNAFYTMKYVEGQCLTDILTAIREGDEHTIQRFPLSRLLNIFQKVCDAIAFAHSRAIVHCDLKPNNIMVCDFGEVIVMDWGLAKKSGTEIAQADTNSTPNQKRSDDQKTETFRVIGTLGFMSPERIHAKYKADPRADIYSLGATLYSILTLRAPVFGEDTPQILRSILMGDIIPPAAYNDPDTLPADFRGSRPKSFAHCSDGKIPVALSDVAMKAMSVNPSHRYASVTEIQADIEAYQNGTIWHLVIDEDFSQPDWIERWDVIGGEYNIQDGELHLAYGEPQGLMLKADLSGNVRIEFECRQDGPYLNCVACFLNAVRSDSRHGIPLTGYKFELGGFDNSVNTIERAGRKLFDDPSSQIVRGQTFVVRAERVGPHLRMFVDDCEVINTFDEDPLSGAERTAVGVLGWLAETVYRRIRIYSLGTPWKSDLLDIAERQVQKGRYDVTRAILNDVLEAFPDAQRAERANSILATANRREAIAVRVSEWRKRLKKAWPNTAFDLRMDNDGLAIEVPSSGILDLEPLRGMPINSLSLPGNQVTSLEPLRGMPITSLNISSNPVADLSPLKGMHLQTLICVNCPIEDLAPLSGMPITLLSINACRVSDLTPLRGMPLSIFACALNRIRSLEPLQGMETLLSLHCCANELETLAPLSGLPLSSLNCSGNRITSLEPLRGMPLRVLHSGDNRIEDIEPLRGMEFRILSLHANRLTTLEPLVDAPLGSLTCGDNQLTDIAVLRSHLPTISDLIATPCQPKN